ncbi:putative quinol monooxygenase [Modestobacter altitudinis]|uniref:putative quinol monooxygenase n=1 Tax=Modestobacter altitudinis TaxID=2213158 RepID=UPI00110D04F1|nr:putative quinol monooxygenase [Modestobacter altitudinis]
MLVILSSATAAPGRRDELVAATRAVAAATRGDRGCLSYSFSADVEDDDRIIGIEVWADQAALDEHMDHDHTQEFLRVAPGLVTGEPVMAFHSVPDDGHADVPPPTDPLPTRGAQQ